MLPSSCLFGNLNDGPGLPSGEPRPDAGSYLSRLPLSVPA